MKLPNIRDFRAVLMVGLAVLVAHPLDALNSEDRVTQMEPTWESMAANYQVPDWFVDGKIGIWTHWGVPSAVDENRPNDGSHYGRRMYGPNEGETGAQLKMTQTLADWHVQRYGDPSEFGYEDLVPLFKAQKWDPEALVRFFKGNGARFIMPVACHHDNFDMYDSSHPWNAVDMGPKRDTLREWKDAAHKHGLKFGVSTHLYWSPRFFNTARRHQTPGTLEAKLFNMEYDPRNYSRQDSWNQHWYDRCWEIIEKYDPDMFNNDSPYPRIGTGKGLGIKLFTDYLNRDLKENDGKQTVVLSFKDGNADRRAFTYNLERGSAADIKPEPWMWATDLSGGWFYRKGSVNRMSIPVMVGNAVDAISKNGVVMLNIALRGDGTLPENQAAYLTAFGDFLRINGEGIYGSRPWKTFGEGPLKMKDGRQGENHKDFSQADIRFTTKDDVLFAFVLAPPTEDIVIKTLASGGLLDRKIAGIELMGSSEEVKWKRSANALTIQLPRKLPGKIVSGFRITTPNNRYLDLSITGNQVQDKSDRNRLDDRSLVISDGSRFVPKDFYPKFSWDTTPLYFMFGDKERVLSPEEVEFIAARTDFLCIEKSHGMGELGAAELGAKHEAAAFKKTKPGTKVLFYFNSAYAWPYTSYNKDFTRERIEANPELKKFLITNPKTGELAHRSNVFFFDVLNPEFREWWVETVARGVRESGCDGAFIDQMHGFNSMRRDKRDEIERAMGDMMAALKTKLGPGKILLGNNACNDDAKFVYPVCDAIMFENYSAIRSTKENLLVEWGDMLRNAKEAKVSVFRLGVEGAGRGYLRSITREEKEATMPKLSQQKLEFALACYLIGAQPYSYFMYSWGWTLSDGSLVDYPELQKPLGAPRGAYQRTTPDGWEFTREFEHASVWVNTESRKAKITWR